MRQRAFSTFLRQALGSFLCLGALSSVSGHGAKVLRSEYFDHILKPRLIQALLDPNPRYEVSEIIFRGNNFWADAYPLIVPDLAKQLQSPNPFALPELGVEMMPFGFTTELIDYLPKVREGLAFQREYFAEILKRHQAGPTYRKLMDLTKPRPVTTTKRTQSKMDYWRAYHLTKPIFTTQYGVEPEKAPPDLQRVFEKLLQHQMEILTHETRSPQLSFEYPSSKKLMAELHEIGKLLISERRVAQAKLKRLLNEERKLKTFVGGSHETEIEIALLSKTLEHTLSSYRLLQDGMSPQEVFNRLERWLQKVDVAWLTSKQKKEYGIKNALIPFADFFWGIVWQGLKQDPLYWEKRDRLARENFFKRTLKAKPSFLGKKALSGALVLAKLASAAALVSGLYSLLPSHPGTEQKSAVELSPELGRPRDGDGGNGLLFRVTGMGVRQLKHGHPFVFATNTPGEKILLSLPPAPRIADIRMELLRPARGFLGIPTPLGYKIVGYKGPPAEVWQTAPGIFTLVSPNKISEATFYFDRDPASIDEEAHQRDPYLNDFNKEALRRSTERLRSGALAGAPLTAISDSLASLSDKKAPISLQDIAAGIGGHSVYKLTRTHPEWVSDSGSLPQWTDNGVLYGKCDVGNYLFNLTLQDAPRPPSHEVRQVSELLLSEGQLSLPGHSEVQVLINGKVAGTYDATPRLNEAPQAREKDDSRIAWLRPTEANKPLLSTDPFRSPARKEDDLSADTPAEERKATKDLFVTHNSDAIFLDFAQRTENLRAERFELWRSEWENRLHGSNQKLLTTLARLKIPPDSNPPKSSWPHHRLFRLGRLAESVARGQASAQEWAAVVGAETPKAEILLKATQNFLLDAQDDFLASVLLAKKDAAFRRDYGHYFNDDVQTALFTEIGPESVNFLNQALDRGRTAVATERLNLSCRDWWKSPSAKNGAR